MEKINDVVKTLKTLYQNNDMIILVLALLIAIKHLEPCVIYNILTIKAISSIIHIFIAFAKVSCIAFYLYSLIGVSFLVFGLFVHGVSRIYDLSEITWRAYYWVNESLAILTTGVTWMWISMGVLYFADGTKLIPARILIHFCPTDILGAFYYIFFAFVLVLAIYNRMIIKPHKKNIEALRAYEPLIAECEDKHNITF